MENIHNAIAWYQKKIGSYDKQLWEQSVEKKLQKGLPNAHHAPRKTVRLKTEYIDVDLIRGSTFTKTKPQVPWIYITRKAIVRVLFFPFYYRWWVLQSSKKVFYLMFTLYLFQVVTAFVYFCNVDGSIIEDELTLTEVVVPIGLMFLLGLIHSQTVLAHFSLKPPRRDGRSGSKQKKRQRHVSPDPDTSTQQPYSEAGVDRKVRELSPSRSHRHTASLWKIPKVEVSTAETPTLPPSPSALRQNCTQARSLRSSSKRGEKKSVRILEASQTCGSQMPGGWKVADSCTDEGQSQRASDGEKGNAAVAPQPGHKCDVRNPSKEAAVDGSARFVKEEVRVGRDRCDGVVMEKTDGCVGKDAKTTEADKSSSGMEDGCDSGAACESETGQGRQDTTDSDSLAGRFEFVHFEDRGLRESQSSDDLTCVPAAQSYSERGALSDREKLPRKLALGDISKHTTHSRASLSEDCTTDQKDEDNFSDTGHVSNSSNYNPSDSGSDAENCDDGDSVGMPVPKTPISSSSTLEPEGSGNLSSSTHPSSTSLTASPRKMAQQTQQLEGESSASDPGSPDARQSMSGIRRRRRTNSNQGGAEQAEGSRTRPLLPKLLGLRAQSKVTQTSGISSSENETGGLSPESVNKATISSEEWEDRMQSDVTTSSSYSTSNSESELSENADNLEENEDDELANEYLPANGFHGINLLQPEMFRLRQGARGSIPCIVINGKPVQIVPGPRPTSTNPNNHGTQPDKVSCMIWEGNECKKLDLTAMDIGWAIIDKVDNLPESSDYIFIGVTLSLCLGCVPFLYRFYSTRDVPTEMSPQVFTWLWTVFKKNSWGQNLIIFNSVVQRLALSLIFFFLLTVTDRTFKQRLLYAKHFSYLTSCRRARKFDMPHFRLNKVRNIKIWLSLRSYLKRRGPQRSVDVIVSASFYLTISLVCLMCIQMLKDSETYLDYLCNWELVVWCLALGIYIMRFMTLGLKINKKYRNLSVLITEQINLYLQMEQKPHKKEELTLANNVLRLAEDLLKELESPFKISGFSANPLIYNITKVVVLSAFSAVMTELLGFKLKLYKIKFK